MGFASGSSPGWRQESPDISRCLARGPGRVGLPFTEVREPGRRVGLIVGVRRSVMFESRAEVLKLASFSNMERQRNHPPL